jgi:DNA polymerase III delta subunit
MTFAEFQALARGGAVPPAIILHGDEPFLARLGIDLLKKRFLTPGSEPFDFLSLSGGETTVEAIASHAGTLPMLSERRVVVVYEVERLSPKERVRLLSYLRTPTPEACVVLVSFERLGGGAKFERELLSSAPAVLCERPSPDVLAPLVRQMSEERGAPIEDDALSALIDWTNGDLTRIANELDKLVSFVGSRARVALPDVDAVVGAKASTLADLALAIAGREPGRALSLLRELADGGVDEAQLVSQLYAFWVALWLARSGGGTTTIGGRQGSLVGGNRLSELSRSRTSREYARGVECFLRADTDIRRGMAPGPTVGLLVHELAGGA